MENLIVYESPFEKIRIGKKNDGGYIVSIVPGDYDLLISGGISGDISFEKHFLSLYTNIKGFGFDGTIQKLPENIENFLFVKKNLGNSNNDNTTNLIEYMKEYNDIFMKIDIEGHEFRVLPEIINNGYISKIKQLVIEIHSPADIRLYPDYYFDYYPYYNKD